jgi:hypothetical protein
MPRMAEAFLQGRPRVKMICGMISARKELFETALGPLSGLLGPVDMVGDIMDFDFTHYYDAQMGSPLYRRFVAFSQLASPDTIVEAKLGTNRIEKEIAASVAPSLPAVAPARAINLDPGYIESSKLVLASMKNFSHRIYLGRGVYAEVTLMYRKVGWDALPWTFPDYASGRYGPFLTAVRERLREQLQEAGQ